DVLAGLAGPDRHQGVPVVGRGDRDSVEILVFQGLADVLDGLRLLAAFRASLFESLPIGARVRIDEISDFHAVHPRPRPDMRSAPAVQAGDGNVDGVVSPQDAAGGFGSGNR